MNSENLTKKTLTKLKKENFEECSSVLQIWNA